MGGLASALGMTHLGLVTFTLVPLLWQGSVHNLDGGRG